MSASKVEDYFWSGLNSTETCIDTLELLAAGKTVHADVEKQGMAMLAGMLMVIILDPTMKYMGIRQKDRKDERDQNR